MEHKVIGVAVGLILRNGKVLVGKRTSGYYSGFWEYPGGKIEQNESSYNALVRELDEELGIQVSKASYILDIRENHPQPTVHLQAWHIHDFEGTIVANEQQDLQWCSIESLCRIQVIPTNSPITEFLEQLTTE